MQNQLSFRGSVQFIESGRRVHHNKLLYLLVFLSDLFTSLAIIMLQLIPEPDTTYIIYIAMTFVRCAVWISNSVHLAGFSWNLIRLYFMLDSIMLMQISSILTYLSLNYNRGSALSKVSISLYPLLIFCLGGNFRVMMIFCQWSRCQYLAYKLLRFFAAIFYLGYGVFMMLNQQANSQMFLLFLFTTFGLYAEMIAVMSSMDGTDQLVPRYNLLTQNSQFFM